MYVQPSIPAVPAHVEAVEIERMHAAGPPPVAHKGLAPPTGSAPSSLSAERAVLDEARGLMASGDGAGAFALLEEHRHRFARPQLAEEREAIAVQALITMGRNGEARARAERFKATTPNSLFLPAIEASLATIP
jgi:hypothetical protein